MAVITSGKTFANGEQLSASKLNQVITAATFNASDAVDGSTMTLIGGAMAVADEGIATGKIAPGAVNFSKLTDVLDENDMSSDSDTSLATQQSIKAYVDAGDANQIGVGQTWQNVLSSRSKNTWFQNTTGRPIQAVISIRADGSNDGNVQVATDSSSSSTYINIAILGFDASESGTTITIPNNYYYRYESSGTFLRTWCELR